MATFLKDDQNVLVRDQNRYRKIYRYMRKKPRPLYCEGSNISNFVWGNYFVEFDDQSKVEHTFPCCYESAPAIVATIVSKGTQAGSAAKVSYMTFGEQVIGGGPDSSDTVVGSINDAKKAYIEREWIDLKNVDGTIHRVRFDDDTGSDAFAAHSDKPGYTVNHTVTVDISDVSHYGLGTSYTGGNSAVVAFEFRNNAVDPDQLFYSNTLLGYNPPGKPKVSVFLGNLWWDFSNKDGTVWRVKIAGGGNYPESHTTNARTRTPNKVFDITISASTDSDNLGQWITELKSKLASVDVDGSKFTDKWTVTSSNGTGTGTGAGDTAAKLTFTAATGNKGPLPDLAGPAPTNPKFYDSYVKARGGSEPDSIAFQSGSPTAGNGTEAETLSKGLMTAIMEKCNLDGTFSAKWTTSVSSNSVERVDAGPTFYETFVLTFTATAGNSGVIANITDPTDGKHQPGTFYYGYNQYLKGNELTRSPGADIFRLHDVNLYSKERYPTLNEDPPDPAPIISANGTAGGTGQPTTTSNPNHNVFVTDITTSGCKFRTSGYFTGYVYYQALVDGAYTMPNIGKSLEVKTLQFDGTNDFVTYTFTASFTCEPIVTVTASEDVNAFVTALSKTSVTVEVSKAGYNGKVYIQAIEKGC